jgi:FkbM family methyltransferase
VTEAAPAAEAPGDRTSSRQWAPSWQTRRGLLRSLLIYYGVPFKLRRLADLYRPFVEPGDLCFDVGAHVGDRTRALRRLGARVVAIEPQPACLGFLQWMYRNDKAVTVVAAGVGEAEGEATLLVSERTPTVSSLSASWVEGVRHAPRFAGVTWDGWTPVRVTTLDALTARFGRPSFCKLDVEGSELAALTGLTQAIPVVTFEYIPAQRQAAQACLARLESLDRYEYNWTEREVPRLRSAGWLSPKAMASLLDGWPDGAHSGDIFARLRRAVGSRDHRRNH